MLFTVLVIYLLFNTGTLSTNLKQNVELFLYKLLPAIFPYIFLTQILIESGLICHLSFGLSKFASKIFSIPEYCCPAIIISLLMGYPNAAKYITKLYNEKRIDTHQAQSLLGFTSCASPSYVISTLGVTFYGSFSLGVILLVSHILSSLILGMILGIKYKDIIQQNPSNSYISVKKNKGFEIISNSIFNTLKTLGIIFCFMAIFSCVSRLICVTLNLNPEISAITIAITEITNGLSAVASSNIPDNLKILITSFCLSFGSFMIIYQIYAVAHTCRINLLIFFKHKIFHGILSAMITYVLIIILKFELPTMPAFSNIQSTITSSSYLFEILILTSTLVAIGVVKSCYALIRKF